MSYSVSQRSRRPFFFSCVHFLDACTVFSQLCYDKCSKVRGATHMALEWGSECFCGSRKDDYDQHGKAYNCNKECAGDPKSDWADRLR